MHLTRCPDDGGDAVAGACGNEHQQGRRHNAGGHHRQGDGPQGLEGAGAGYLGGLFQGRIHLLHSAGDGDEGVGVIEGGKNPHQAAHCVDIKGVFGQVEEIFQKYIEGAHRGVQKAKPRHSPNVGGHHIGGDEKGAEKLFAVQIGAAHQPGQRKGDQHPQDHRAGGGDNGVSQGGPVHGVGVHPLEGVDGEAPIRSEGADDQIEHGEDFKDHQKGHNGDDDHPFDIEVEPLFLDGGFAAGGIDGGHCSH